MTRSIEFFETQFQKQVVTGDLALNPFEAATLPYLRGRVLDFGCGLGNLSVAAARQGCTVRALDAAPTAIEHLQKLAERENLPIDARVADLRDYRINDRFDAVVCIGLLMFFDCPSKARQLAQLQACVVPGGIAAINVLIEGTTFMALFDPHSQCLFRAGELKEVFAGWEILHESYDNFPAPGDTVKAFATLIARKPG